MNNGMDNSLLDAYLYEENNLLDQLDNLLVADEKDGDFSSDDVNEIFRIMHTIKGSSAMMGFENLSVLAHKAEDMFFVIRENPDVITDVSFVYDLVFQVSDSYKAQIELIQNNINGEYEQMDFSELIDKLLKARDALVGETKGDTPAQAEAIASGAAPDPEVATNGPAPAAAAAPAEEKTEFDVVLAEIGSEKIKVIKVVREVVSGLGLKEAKEIVDGAPKTLKEGVSKDEAEKIKAKFAEVGATVEIK